MSISCSHALAVLAFSGALMFAGGAPAQEPTPATPPQPEVTITITDSTANQMLSQAFAATVGVDQKSDAGYQKGYDIRGNPVREEYENARRGGSLTALVHGRFTVAVEVVELPAEELRTWFDRVDLAKLEALEPEKGQPLVRDTKLIPYVPDPPVGWMAQPATSLGSQGAGFQISQATRVYRKKK
ncbi:MAG: hypothetical protein QOD06_1296 [Candidatus Binatota bacterium]|nr:hypothetical protein [Candidatus Binatota bacterium]